MQNAGSAKQIVSLQRDIKTICYKLLAPTRHNRAYGPARHSAGRHGKGLPWTFARRHADVWGRHSDGHLVDSAPQSTEDPSGRHGLTHRGPRLSGARDPVGWGKHPTRPARSRFPSHRATPSALGASRVLGTSGARSSAASVPKVEYLSLPCYNVNTQTLRGSGQPGAGPRRWGPWQGKLYYDSPPPSTNMCNI